MKSLTIHILLNTLSGAIIGALILGLFALLVAGVDGAVNGLWFGFLLGAFAGLTVAAYVGKVFWWQGAIFRFGGWWQKRQTGEDDYEPGMYDPAHQDGQK